MNVWFCVWRHGNRNVLTLPIFWHFYGPNTWALKIIPGAIKLHHSARLLLFKQMRGWSHSSIICWCTATTPPVSALRYMCRLCASAEVKPVKVLNWEEAQPWGGLKGNLRRLKRESWDSQAVWFTALVLHVAVDYLFGNQQRQVCSSQPAPYGEKKLDKLLKKYSRDHSNTLKGS